MTESENNDGVSTIIAHFAAQLEDAARPFCLIGRFKVKDDAPARVVEAFREASIHTRREAGVIAFDLNHGAYDATQFVVYERWRSLADLEGHLRTPYVNALRSLIDSVIVGSPEFQVLVPAHGLEPGAAGARS